MVYMGIGIDKEIHYLFSTALLFWYSLYGEATSDGGSKWEGNAASYCSLFSILLC